MTADDPGSTPRPTAMLPQSSFIGTVSSGRVAGDRWYIAHTQPRAENRVVANLEWQGYSVFCLRYRKTVRRARKVRSALAPLCPNVPSSGRFSRSLARRQQTGGMVCLISQGEKPQPLLYGVVEDMLAKTNAGVMDWTPTFKIGQAVRIADGPFADLVGKLERLDAAARVLLDLLGRSVSVALRCEALIAAA